MLTKALPYMCTGSLCYESHLMYGIPYVLTYGKDRWSFSSHLSRLITCLSPFFFALIFQKEVYMAQNESLCFLAQIGRRILAPSLVILRSPYDIL